MGNKKSSTKLIKQTITHSVLGILERLRDTKVNDGKLLVQETSELYKDINTLEANGQHGIMSIEALDNILERSHSAILSKIEYLDNLISSVKDTNNDQYSVVCLKAALQV